MQISLKLCIKVLGAICLFFAWYPTNAISDTITDSSRISETYLSLGYGTSYGGFGICAEYRGTSQITGHAGIGYFPAKSATGEEFVNNRIMGAAGIRVYLLSQQRQSRRFYLDAQFGAVGVAAKYMGVYYGTDYFYEEKQQLLFGPSALIGMKFVVNPEQKGNRFFFDVAFGVTVITNNPEWSPLSDVVATLDLGLGLVF